MLRRVSLSATKLFTLSLAAAALTAALIFLYHQSRLGPAIGTEGTTHTQYIVFVPWSELLEGVAIYAACCWLVAFVWHWLKGRLRHH